MPYACSLLSAVMLLMPQASPAGAAGPQPAITLRVLDPDGRPIAGAGAAWATGEWTTDQVGSQPLATSDRDGVLRFAVGKASPSGELPPIAIGARGRIVVVIRLQSAAVQGQELDLGSLHLFPAVTLSGRVVDENGRGLAGARVHASHPLPVGPWSWRAEPATCNFETAAATDADGIYRLDGVPDAAVRLAVTKAGHASQAVFPVRAATPVRVQLPHTGFACGRIDGADGGDLQLSVDYGLPVPSLPATLAADGSFRAPLCAVGRYRIGVIDRELPGCGAATDWLQGPRDDIALRLPATRPLRLVVTADGKPAASFRFAASWVAAAARAAAAPAVDVQFVPERPLRCAGRDGAVELRVPSTAKSGWIQVEAPGMVRARLAVQRPWPAELRCELVGGAVCTGRVFDAATGEPVPVAQLFLVRAPAGESLSFGQVSSSVRTGAGGDFRLENLPPGHWQLQVEHAAYALPPLLPLDVEAGETKAVGDLRLEPLPRLRGRVLGARLPAGARIGDVARGNAQLGKKGIHYQPGRRFRDAEVAADGSFDLGPAAHSLVELQLLLPPRRCSGLPLAIPLGAFATGAGPLEIALPQPLACDVGGKVVVPAEAAGLAELRVFAIAERSLGIPEHPGVRGPRVVASSDLDPANGYAMQLAAGPHQLAAQDLVTGLLVLAPAPLAVGEQASLAHDLTIPLRRVRVQLVAPPDARLAGAELHFAPAERDPTWRRLDTPRFGGLPLQETQREFTVALPPGPVLLRVERGEQLLGEEFVQVPATGPCEFRVPLTEPAAPPGAGR